MGRPRSDPGPTGCRKRDASFRGIQPYQDLIAILAVLLFPTFNHLPGSSGPLKFGIPNAYARLWVRHSVQNGKPRNERKHRRKQNDYFKETDCALGIAIGPL